MANNIERNNSVYYELFSSKFGRLTIQEPRGWSNDVLSYKRDTSSRGITSKVDIDLEFFGSGADYIRNVYNSLGIEEKVILTKYEKDRYSLSEDWVIRYIQELDMTTYKEVERTGNVTVNSTEGGLYSDIKNRESDEYDLLENTSADGIDIGSLTTQPFQALPRKIFIESFLKQERVDFVLKGKNTGNSSTNTRPIPLKIVYNSDQKDVVTPLNGEESGDSINPSYQQINESSAIGDQFFFEAEQNKTISIKFNTELKLKKVDTITVYDSDFTIERRISENVNNTLTVVDTEVLLSAPDFNPGDTFTISDYEEEIVLDQGQSVSIVACINIHDTGISVLGIQNLTFDTKSDLTIEDITLYGDNITTTKCIKPLNFFDRIVAKITGKTGLVKSSVFDVGGEYEYMVIDNGLWARGFPDVYLDANDEEQRIQIVTSFKDAFQSFNYLEPLVWFTEIIGSTEYIRIEKATYTQQNFIGVKLGDVDKIQYESSKVDYFSNISIGHDRSMEYEELNGLDESNGKSEFTTFITKNDSKYEAISKYRTDAIGYELTRRLTFELYPKEDTKRDNDLWIHDAKNVNEVITHKKWNDADRFDELPKGIYDPESSWNLWLSPMNRLFYGHGYSIKRGLYHYPNKFIKFNSSNANQNLITVHQGRSLSESGSIEIKDIDTPRVEATMVNFTFKMTQELETLFKSTTLIGNDNVPNYFGLIEYNERGVKKYGRLVKLESSDEAKITLIKARI